MKNPHRHPKEISSAIFVLSAAVLFALSGMVSCCFSPVSLAGSLSDDATVKSGLNSIFEKSFEEVLEEASSVSNAWIKDGNGKLVWEPSPAMNLNVYQGESTGKYFDVSKPLAFSVESDRIAASNSISSISDESSANVSSEKVEFAWDFGNGETAKGANIEYTFPGPGTYTVTLTASYGSASDTCTETIWVAEHSGNFLVFNKYSGNVEVESVFTNNGPGRINDFAYSIDIPQTIFPFQEVTGVITGLQQFTEKSNENGDLSYRFYLGSIDASKTVSIKTNYEVIMSEFAPNENFKDIAAFKDENHDKIFKQYTKSEKSIDSDSEIIKNRAASITGQETDPKIIAEKLYNYVIDNMDYDWERFASYERENLKASELLQIKKGVCEDYSILYAALCRAAGIPVKYITGLPVNSISREADNELESGHAWNEIYIKDYGWIPVDPTSEIPFLSSNLLLNLRTYSEFQPKALGFSWTYENSQPGFSQQLFYRASGFDEANMAAITMEEYQGMKDKVLGK